MCQKQTKAALSGRTHTLMEGPRTKQININNVAKDNKNKHMIAQGYTGGHARLCDRDF